MVFRRSQARRSSSSRCLRRGKGCGPNTSVLRFEPLESRLMLAGDLYVDLVTPTGAASNPFESLEVEFSKPVDESTLSVEDFSISGPGTPAVDTVTGLGGNRYQLDLSGTGLDTYSLTIGPEIQDTDGLAMNQDQDATAGEATDDAFVVTLSATALTISDGDTTYDTQDLVLYGNSVTVEGDHVFSDVLVTGGAQLALTGSEIQTGDLTLDGTSTVELAGGSTLDSSGTILVSGTSTLLVKGANIDGQVDGEWVGEGGTITAQNLTVEAGSVIDADGQGYLGGQNNGQGQGPGSPSGGNAGATYAGIGGGGAWGDPNTTTYGSIFEPTDLGSGGGGYDGLGGGTGGTGGGAIRLDVSGTLTLNGEITADGESIGTTRGEGGGSGGSIYVTTEVLTGAGTFSADGGSSLNNRGGGGGGGRVVVCYTDASGFTDSASSTATGGSGVNAGGVGAVAFLDISAGYPSLIVDQNMTLSADESYHFGNVTVRNGATLTIGGGTTVTATGTIHLLENSQIVVEALYTDGQVDGEWAGEGVTINAENVVVEAGSLITADAQGYLGGNNGSGQGPGASDGNTGATHAGIGGDGAWGDPNTTTYGDALAPTDLGSGGNGYDGLGAGTGGAGGGALHLDVSGTLTLNGKITADGQSIGTGRGEGGGSGGSLYVTAETLTGTGTFSADGGSSLTNRGGGGGGGRVVVYYLDDGDFGGATSSTANGGTGVQAGTDGSVGFFQVTDLANHLTDATRDLTVYTTYRYDSKSSLALNTITVGDSLAAGAVFAVGGGATLDVAGTIHVTNNSTILAQATNTSAPVDGGWQGSGVRINADTVTIDAGSAISADGQGYDATSGPAPGGSAGYGSAGGAHAGAGGHGAAGAAAQTATYGSAYYATTLGSGGGNPNEGGAGGGAIWLDVGDTLTVNGRLSADGETAIGRGGGGAGGSLLVSAGTVTGSGTISANGGDFGSDYGGGGGAGHLVVSAGDLSGTLLVTADGGGASAGGGGGGGGSVYAYPWTSMTLPAENLTAAGGVGSQATGSDGSVVIADEPHSQWLDESGTLFHDSEVIGWLGLGFDPAAVSVTLVAASDINAHTIADSLPYADSFTWDTTSVADGRYELRAVFRENGVVLKEIAREVLVNNSVHWHSGTIAQDETWAADAVHVIESDISVSSGVTVTVEAGTVLKFASGVTVTVEDGATLDAAAATESQPIVFTSLADDSIGGDTTFDGTSSVPLPGSWNGVTPVGSGQFLISAHTNLRYAVAEHSGVLTANEVWLGTFLHRITDHVTVPDGLTLTIEPGAVVKFDTLKELTIQGTLDAQGTIAEPIVFTSIRDDSVAGDSNGDGSTTAASAGDWRWIYVDGGTAALDHVSLRYGGGTTSGAWDATGILRTRGNADLTLSNSIVRDVFFDGVLNWGGTTTIENTVLTDIDRAITSHVDSNVTVTNCTIDDSRIGLLAHGGALSVRNTIVANSLEYGVLHDLGNAPTFSHTNVWAADGSGSINYHGVADPTGTDGNLSVDPRFNNRAQDDYRLTFGSPMIDAADGTVAPTTDRMGAPRYDDPRTANTGVAMPDGSVPDLGAYEFVEDAESDVDLVVTSIRGPVDAMAGDMATVSWTVTNVGSGTGVGPWHDVVYLADSLDGDDLGTFAGETLVGSGVSLGPGESLTASATVRVPGATTGNHYWQVKTNRKGEVFEGQNRANNLQTSGMPVALDLPELTIDGSGLVRTFSEVGESHWFKFVPSVGQDILVSLDLAGDAGTTELYVARGRMPSRTEYDACFTEWQSADTNVLAADTVATTYYVLAHAKSLSDGPASFTVSAESLDFSLMSVSPNTIGNTGSATLKLEGGQLSEDLTYRLVGPSSTTSTATGVYVVDSSTVYATFDATGLPLGLYDVEVVASGHTVALHDVVEVVTGTPAELEVHLSVPEMTRPGWTSPVVIDYKNTGNVDMVAPLMLLEGPGANLAWPGDTNTQSTMLLIGISPEGPAGILRPGQEGIIRLEMTPGTDVSEIDFTLSTSSDPDSTIDWNSFKADFAPDSFETLDQNRDVDASLSPTVWDAYYAVFEDSMGSTAGLFQQTLASMATRMGQIGERVYDGAKLVDCAMMQVDPTGEMLVRGTDGALGKFWPDITVCKAEADDDDNLTVTILGYDRYYVPQADGTYLATNGDGSRATLVNGLYHLEEWDGMRAVFRADGTLDYIESPNGNRTTASYVEGKLTKLDGGPSGTTTYTYDANGRLVTLTDPAGQSTVFTYSEDGYMTNTVFPGGLSADMTYNRSGISAGTLSTMSFGGTEIVDFEFDQQGRFIGRSLGDTSLTLSYDTAGGTTVTDASGRTLTIWRDQRGDVRRIVDGIGSDLRFTYDGAGRVTSLTRVGTATQYFSYDTNGNLSEITDSLGNRTRLRHDSSNQLVSAQNANGNTTAFTYDSAGNLILTTHPDGTTERMTYDSRGRVTSWTNRRGVTVNYSYDPERDLLTGKSYGSYAATYTYNETGYLVSASDNNGTTSMVYNAAGQLTRITYPTDQWIEIGYSETGHRTQMIDQDGFAVKYEYNNLNLISRLSRADGSTIAEYTYDSAGLLQRKDLGNGQYSTYTYDGVGHLTGLYNHASNGTLVSKYEYAYDKLGRRISMTTLDGVYAYTYDLNDQLTSVTTPGGRTIQYSYDSMGNRLAVSDDGTTTEYAVNSLNQYTSIGSAALTYDADGNLISKSDGSQNWSYTYDAEGRILSANGPSGILTYEYDALGNRIASVLDGTRTEYLLDPFEDGAIFAEFDASGQAIARYQRGYGLLGQVDASGNDCYFHFDGSGNTVQIVDDAEATLNSYEYLPFGSILASSETVHNPFLFAGEKGVAAAGNGDYFANVRQYDPEMGRFLSPDWHFQPAANPYTYGSNQPNSRYDSNGYEDDATSNVTDAVGNISAAGDVVNTIFDLTEQADTAAVFYKNLQNARDLYAAGKISLSDLKSAEALLKQNNCSGATAAGGSVLKGIGYVGDGVGVVTSLQKLNDVYQGKQPGFEAFHALGTLGAIGAKHLPWSPVTAPLILVGNAAGMIDVGSQLALGEILKHRPKPADEIFGDRGLEFLNNPNATPRTNVGNGVDPNDIIGPSGYGDSNWIARQQIMPYTIRFENDAEEATAPAQQVVVTQALDDDLDLSTFQLTGFGFGSTTHQIAAGLSDYQTQIDLSATHGVLVDVDIDLDVASRLVTWTFTSLDPTTEEPTRDPYAGFLPPNDTSPEGEGWVAYRVEPEASLASGTAIDAQARIVFDINDPIDTNLWTNTIDAGAPTSQVAALPTEGLGSSVLVSWTGTDEAGNGSGIAAYDIYVSKDDGLYDLWLAGTQDTSATFSGTGISTYRFYSVAIDNVGNREAAPDTADAQATFLDQWFTGTAADDTFEFIAGATNDAWVVRLNDVTQAIDSRATGVHFDGLDGNDTVTLTGTDGVDVADLYPTNGKLVGDTYAAAASNVEAIHVNGGAGLDVVSFYDSAGDDTIFVTVGETTFTGNGFEHTASGFPVVHAYAKNGGVDTASLCDSVGDDTFRVDSENAKLYGPGFYHRVKFFDVVHGYGKAGGSDTARFFDSVGDERFIAYPDFSKMYGPGYFRRAKFFETTVAYATAGGTDVARLFDSSGDDRLITTPTKARLYDTAGTYDVTARWFDTTVAYASTGHDTARLFGLAGAADFFRGRSHKSTYYGTGYYHTIRRFDTVTVYGNGDSGDVARLHDTAGDDHLVATHERVSLSRSNGTRTLYHAIDFPTVRAYSTTGNDTTEIEAAVDFLMLEGAWQD